MAPIPCLRCKAAIEPTVDSCPQCGERVTAFQRTYAGRLIDGKYEIVERLGMGGMGEIFKVRHIHLDEQRVIKIMRANIASDDQALNRFLHEARTSTMIKHRNLAMLYDFSTLEDGSYYMVWEFIEGTNVQKWIAKNGPVPPRLTLEIAIQALEGLDHLHSMGLIHRDISPENLMLSNDRQGKLLVKVIDFGIAKQLQEGEGGQGLTQTGMFLGKLKYASPEQAGFMKEGEKLDPRSDLYSFGVVMYEMLAGRAPFQASNPQGYILKHATEKPLPIARMNPEVSVPARLEAEVLRALAKDRDDRHASGAEFAARLEALRGEISPDGKFGVGDWRGVVSEQPTLADRTRGTKVAPTVVDPARAARVPETDAPTVVTAPSAAASRPEPVEETVRSGALRAVDDATLVEPSTFPGAPTVVERGEARPLPRPRRTSGAIAAAIGVVVLLAGGIYFVTTRKAATGTQAQKPAVTGSATATAPATSAKPAERTETAISAAAAGQGELLLIATPYGHIEQVVNKNTNSKLNLTDEDRWTPARLNLPAGDYQLVVSSPDGLQRKTLDVTLVAGQQSRPFVTFGKPDINALSEEFLKR